MTGERLTEDLLKRLLAASSPEAYLEEGLTMERTFAGYLHELLEAKGLQARRCVSRFGIEFYRGLRRFCRKEPTRTR